MEITTDMKDDFLSHTQLIENVEVVYKKKKKHNGELSTVKHEPIEVSISDEQSREDPEHTIDFDLAEQINIKFSDGTIKTYQDEIA